MKARGTLFYVGFLNKKNCRLAPDSQYISLLSGSL